MLPIIIQIGIVFVHDDAQNIYPAATQQEDCALILGSPQGLAPCAGFPAAVDTEDVIPAMIQPCLVGIRTELVCPALLLSDNRHWYLLQDISNSVMLQLRVGLCHEGSE